MYMASAGNVLPSRFPDMTGPYWGFPWMQTKKFMEMMQKLWEQNAAEMDNNMAGGITGNAEEITELKAK